MSLHTSDLVLVPGQQLPPLETIFRISGTSRIFPFFRANCHFQRRQLYDPVPRRNVL